MALPKKVDTNIFRATLKGNIKTNAGFDKLVRTRISDQRSGSQSVKDAMKKNSISGKQAVAIFKNEEELGGFKNNPRTTNEDAFFKEEKKAERIHEREAKIHPENQEGKIKQARKEGTRAERWRGAMFGRGAIREQERVYQSGEEYRKQERATSGVQKEQEKKYEIRVRGAGHESSKDKVNALLERVETQSGPKSAVDKNSSASPTRSSGGMEIRGTAGIDSLTHPDQAGSSLASSGVMHAEGLDSAQNQPAPAPKSTPSPKNENILNDMDIG